LTASEELREKEFFSYALQLGLCEIVKAATNHQREVTFRRLFATTDEYNIGRDVLFGLNDPDLGDDKPTADIREYKDYSAINSRG
jgi:hypothetical protein